MNYWKAQEEAAKKKKRPSKASGLRPTPGPSPGQGSTARLRKKIKKEAQDLGNALLPGNPFG